MGTLILWSIVGKAAVKYNAYILEFTILSDPCYFDVIKSVAISEDMRLALLFLNCEIAYSHWLEPRPGQRTGTGLYETVWKLSDYV